jgi:expansin (peptidoglycan-binding protein)
LRLRPTRWLAILATVHRALFVIAGLGLSAACSGGCADDELSDEPCRNDVGPFTGEATHYDADGSGNCSFPAGGDLMVAAMNSVDYKDAAWCGSCVAVSGPNGEVTVRIVDSCPGCDEGDLDLSKEAFAKIANLTAGRVPISWRPVACAVTGPIAYHFKDGSNAFWTGIQIRNHRYAISSLEVRDAAGAYTKIGRTDYNYFVQTKGLGAGPYTLRVTDTRANVVEDAAIALGDSVSREGAAQFPMCP